MEINEESAEKFRLEVEANQRKFDDHVKLNMTIASILAPDVEWKSETYTTQVKSSFTPSEYFCAKDFRFDYIDDQSFRMMIKCLVDHDKLHSEELREYCSNTSNETLAKVFVERMA